MNKIQRGGVAVTTWKPIWSVAVSGTRRTRSFSRDVRRSLTHAALLLFLMMTVAFAGSGVRAMEGDDGIFDPSTIIKVGTTYHVFGDGQGITHKTSTDLVSWTNVSTVFGSGSGPSWIQTYVPGFSGYFWAPDIIQMGGKYYLYYSCSTFGSKVSAIGVATSTDLNTWTDQGLVLASGSNSPYNAIDPGIFKDASGNPWMSWGSWNNGIYDAQVNSSTGKLANSTKYNIVNISDAEASEMIYHGGYYYIFYNRGTCCNGTSSTYYVNVARSTSPSSGFSGNRVYIASSSPCIGPGHFGYLSDGGTEYVSYHYVDANSNGYPRLAVSHLTWSNGWPLMSPDWIANGTYKVTNSASGLAWDDWGCTGAAGQALAQNTYNGLTCQKWVFHQLGWGSYYITCATGGRAVDALNCSNANGTPMDIYDYWGGSCQQWKIYRASDGTYVFATMNGSGNGTSVIDVPNGTGTLGAQLDLWGYNGFWTQKWNISAP